MLAKPRQVAAFGEIVVKRHRVIEQMPNVIGDPDVSSGTGGKPRQLFQPLRIGQSHLLRGKHDRGSVPLFLERRAEETPGARPLRFAGSTAAEECGNRAAVAGGHPALKRVFIRLISRVVDTKPGEGPAIDDKRALNRGRTRLAGPDMKPKGRSGHDLLTCRPTSLNKIKTAADDSRRRDFR